MAMTEKLKKERAYNKMLMKAFRYKQKGITYMVNGRKIL